MQVTYASIRIEDVDLFYREAGPPNAPALLLLHGFLTSSHMFRDLMPGLADRYRVIAPDLPGFSQTVAPGRATFAYSFDHLAQIIEGFTEAMGLVRYALYIFDYGAPVGLQLAIQHPERVTAIVTQNGNAYEEGLGGTWDAWRSYWREPTMANRESCRSSLSDEPIQFQYLEGAPAGLVSPDGMALDIAHMHEPEAMEVQLDLILDYRTNVALYPAFQAYFREHRPPPLAAWGRHDPFFLAIGAEAFRRDLPDAEIHLLDAGHFALETHHPRITHLMQDFLQGHAAP